MNLLKSLKAAIDISSTGQNNNKNASLNPEMAAAVLLIAMERADFEASPDERSEIERLLAKYFALDAGEVESILVRAEEEAGQSVSFFDYVEHLNAALAYEEKCQVLKMLWQVAYADGQLDPFEEQLMRRLADMLYLSHSDYVRTKLQVIE